MGKFSLLGQVGALLWVASVGLLGAGLAGARGESLGTVTLYLSTDCPVAQSYGPRLDALEERYGDQFTFQAYFPNDLETRAGAQAFLVDRGLEMPFALDFGGELARKDEVETIPTVVVRDAAGKLVYHGAIDDHKTDELVRERYLEVALEALAKGETPSLAKTEAFGCLLMAEAQVPTLEAVTYAEHVKPILDRACVTCHRPSEVAPFSLVGYENASKWSAMIARVTESRKMPPWLASPEVGKFVGDPSLTDAEIEILRRWDEAGAPRGAAEAEPADPVFPSGEWALGPPDMILEMPDEHELAPSGRDEYWHFVLDPKVTEPVYVTALDVRPGNRSVVHHVIAFIDNTGAARELVNSRGNGVGYETFGGPGFMPKNALGGWAPGMRPVPAHPGTGIRIEPGDEIVMQVHYNKSGRKETDRTKMGLYFAKEPVDTSVEVAWLANPFIQIPAGEARSRQTLRVPIRRGAQLFALMPHMHLLGQEMRAKVIYPDGREEALIDVPRWDFKWQLSYQLVEPKILPPGSVIEIEAIFDNSDGNPNNPHSPPQEVRWGEETSDEMLLLVAFVAPLPEPVP